jgi:hypothetical protein
MLIAIALMLWPARPLSAAPTAASLSTSLLFECLPDNSVRVVFQWASTGEGPQWVDISVAEDGFATGFLSHGPLAPGESVFAWNGLVPGVWHQVRVNTLTNEGWAPSPTMLFDTPSDCPFASAPRPAFADPQGCKQRSDGGLSGCVWTPKSDYGSYAVGERVDYCYSLNRPDDVRIIATRPDGTSFIVVDGYVSGPASCVGPYSAGEPLGLRTVSMYAGSDNLLLSESHFYVR